jgi:hypothetical protein
MLLIVFIVTRLILPQALFQRVVERDGTRFHQIHLISQFQEILGILGLGIGAFSIVVIVVAATRGKRHHHATHQDGSQHP